MIFTPMNAAAGLQLLAAQHSIHPSLTLMNMADTAKHHPADRMAMLSSRLRQATWPASGRLQAPMLHTAGLLRSQESCGSSWYQHQQYAGALDCL